jgi:hypothetical protein
VSTPLHIVSRIEPYLGLFAEGADLFAQAQGTKPESVATLAALALRESWCCDAPGYRPRGSPDGTGDWTARTGHWTRREGVQVFADTPENRERLRELGWSLPKRKKPDGSLEVVPGPYAIPGDALGFGRGILQMDALGDFRALYRPAPWPVERQAYAACAMLDKARVQLARFADHPLYPRAVIARYNAAIDRVVAGLEAGAVDVGTTGGDYSADVEALRNAVIARFPDRFRNERGLA